MKLLVLGATGPTGMHVVERALELGDEVTALVRRPEALEGFAERAEVIKGDATSLEDVDQAMDGQDAVISTLGRSMSFRADDLFTRSAAAVVAAMRTSGVQRLVWLSSFGVGDTFASASFMQKLFYRSVLRGIYANKAESEKALRSSGLDWTIVYPTALTHGTAKGAYYVGERIPMKGNPRISRADVGRFLHLAVHDPAWIGRDAVITD